MMAEVQHDLKQIIEEYRTKKTTHLSLLILKRPLNIY